MLCAIIIVDITDRDGITQAFNKHFGTIQRTSNYTNMNMVGSTLLYLIFPILYWPSLFIYVYNWFQKDPQRDLKRQRRREERHNARTKNSV